MNAQGQNEGFRIVDESVCDAIRGPGVPQAPSNQRGQNEGVRILEEGSCDLIAEGKENNGASPYKEPSTLLVPLATLTPDQVKAADIIEAVDPKKPSYRQQVWGQGVVPTTRPWPSGPHLVRTVEVQIDSTQQVQFQDLLHQIKTIKGCLHPEVEKLIQ